LYASSNSDAILKREFWKW